MKSSVLIAISVGLAWAFPAQAQKQVTKSFTMPVQAHVDVGFSDCSNSPGPQITLSGSITLGGLNVDLVFRNNMKGTHTYVAETTSEITVIPEGGSLVIPKQPPLGGVGGNPFIWLQFLDADGNPLSNEIFLGRCVQGSKKVNSDLGAFAFAAVDIGALDCRNNTGPYIYVEGATSFPDGVNAQLIFRNNNNPVGGPHEAIRSAVVTIIPAGLTLTFPKQPVLGGVGGNPWIFTRFEQGDGTAIGKEVLLGRCVQLAPGN